MPKILLVDDDAEDRSMMIDAIGKLDRDDMIFCAENGEVALRYLNQFAELDKYPCLIVLDLNMPKMNGKQTLEHLKQHQKFKDINVVIFSTSINPIEKEACMQLGAQDYLAKPVSYRESLDIAGKFLKMCDAGISEVGSV